MSVFLIPERYVKKNTSCICEAEYRTSDESSLEDWQQQCPRNYGHDTGRLCPGDRQKTPEPPVKLLAVNVHRECQMSSSLLPQHRIISNDAMLRRSTERIRALYCATSADTRA